MILLTYKHLVIRNISNTSELISKLPIFFSIKTVTFTCLIHSLSVNLSSPAAGLASLGRMPAEPLETRTLPTKSTVHMHVTST